MRVLWLFWALLGVAAPSFAASIGIYANPACSGTHSTVNSGDVITLYVVANTSPGPASEDVTLAEYRISGLPSGWDAVAVRAPASNVSIGNPFADGVIIAFPDLQTGCVLLHTLSVHATSNVQDATLQVVAHVTPSGPFGIPPGDCPWLLFYYCGSCDKGATCVEGLAHMLNPTVANQHSSWSWLKALYRE